MELGPVKAIQAVRPAGVSWSASEVMPAFAVEGSGRMEDDCYGGDARGQDRGMEEDTVELGVDAEQEDGAGAEREEGQQVNLFV
jgi:hypothetical protein